MYLSKRKHYKNEKSRVIHCACGFVAHVCIISLFFVNFLLKNFKCPKVMWLFQFISFCIRMLEFVEIPQFSQWLLCWYTNLTTTNYFCIIFVFLLQYYFQFNYSAIWKLYSLVHGVEIIVEILVVSPISLDCVIWIVICHLIWCDCVLMC